MARKQGELAEQVDGRTARRLRTRDAILDAMLELLSEGEMRPALSAIAARAGVTQRTLFNHFPEIDEALGAALLRSRETTLALLPEVPDDEDPAERVRAFYRQAIPFLERYSALRWVALNYAGDVPGFDPRQKRGFVLQELSARVDELALGFGVRLAGDGELEAAVRVTTDPLAWRLLRVQQGLSKAKAAEASARALTALLGKGGS